MVGEEPQVTELTREDRIAPDKPLIRTRREDLLRLPKGHQHPRRRFGKQDWFVAPANFPLPEAQTSRRGRGLPIPPWRGPELLLLNGVARLVRDPDVGAVEGQASRIRSDGNRASRHPVATGVS